MSSILFVLTLIPKLIYTIIRDSSFTKLIQVSTEEPKSLETDDLYFPYFSRTSDQALINGTILFQAKRTKDPMYADNIQKMEFAMSKYVLSQDSIADMFIINEENRVIPGVNRGTLSPYVGIALAYHNATNNILRENTEIIVYNKALEIFKPKLTSSISEALYLYVIYKMLSKSGTASGIRLFRNYKAMCGGLVLLKLALTQEEFFLMDLLSEIEENKYLKKYLKFIVNLNKRRFDV